jgi:hypothetical protein
MNYPGRQCAPEALIGCSFFGLIVWCAIYSFSSQFMVDGTSSFRLRRVLGIVLETVGNESQRHSKRWRALLQESLNTLVVIVSEIDLAP